MFGILILLALALPARAHLDLPDPVAADYDVLVYKDGDRLKGHLKERSSTELVFISDRFGRLVVPVANAKVILANGEDDAMAEERAHTEEAMGPFSMRTFLSLKALRAELQDYVGPWHGRFAVSTHTQTGATELNSDTVEAHLHRKLPDDNVQLNARYDFSESNNVTTTDVMKADAAWRHDFKDRLFSLYGPSLEWNRAYANAGRPADYFLLQQEIGGGVNVFKSIRRNLRVGVSENLFDQWQLVAPESHNSKTSESAFLESDMKLPWQMTLTERGVWYYSFNTGRDGWENKIELDKKLTETFVVGVRHEVRYNNPGLTVQDYSLLKLLMGVDF